LDLAHDHANCSVLWNCLLRRAIKTEEMHFVKRRRKHRAAFLLCPSAESACRQRDPRRLVRIVEIERDGDTHEKGDGPCWLAGAFDRFEAHVRAPGRTRQKRDTWSIGRRAERERERRRESGIRCNEGEYMVSCRGSRGEKEREREREKKKKEVLEALVKKRNRSPFPLPPSPVSISLSLYDFLFLPSLPPPLSIFLSPNSVLLSFSLSLRSFASHCN